MSLQLSTLFWHWRGKLACLPAPKETKKGLLALVFSHTQNLQSAVSVGRPITPGHFYQSFFHIINTKNTVTKHLRKIKKAQRSEVFQCILLQTGYLSKNLQISGVSNSPHINKRSLLYCWNLANKWCWEEKLITKKYS